MSGRLCANHPNANAKWQCESCGKYLCEDCVREQSMRGTKVQTCSECGGMCLPVASSALASPRRSFFAELPGLPAYPFNTNGIFILTGGTIFYAIARVLTVAPVFGWLVSLFAGGYLASYMLSVIRSTARGEDSPPDWPGYANFWDDIIVPVFQVAGTSLICMGPAVLYAVLSDNAYSEAVFVTLITAGLAYLPMALIAVAMNGTITAVNPLVVVPAIARVFLHYIVAFIVLALIVYVRGVAEQYIGGGGVLVYLVLDPLLMIYVLMLEMRLLGLLYRCNAERIGWY